MRLHVALARRMSANYPGVPILFVSFFWRTIRYLRELGLDAVYLPELLNRARPDECSDALLQAVEEEAFVGSGGANLQLMLQAERFLPKDAQAANRFLRTHVLVLNSLVRPGTWSVGSMYDHFVYWLAGSLANARGGRHFAMVGAAVPPGSTMMLRTPWELWYVPISETEAARLLEVSRESLTRPLDERICYMRPMPPRPPRPRGYYRDFMSDLLMDRRAHSYFAVPPWLPIRGKLEKVWPRAFTWAEPTYDVADDATLATIRGPYVYFPLHMEPEATLLMYSPWCRDQIEAARLVSQALPAGWKLLVKENPKMQRRRPLAYYRTLTSLPNVMLVHPHVSTIRLAQNAQATIAIAGNAALEAVLLGRPGICLGRPPFRRLLTAADFAESLKLAEMFRWLSTCEFPSPKLSLSSWHLYVSGCVLQPLPYVSFGTDIGFTDEASLVEAICAFIRVATVPEGVNPKDSS